MYTERIDAATVETGVLIGRTQLTHSSRFLRAETHFTPYQNIFHVLQNSSLQKLIQIGMKKKKMHRLEPREFEIAPRVSRKSCLVIKK